MSFPRQYELICVGASWGGLHAIGRLLADIPDDVAQPIVIAQHRAPNAIEGALAELLGRQTSRPVADVDDKAPIERGHVYVAPPDYHLLIERGSFALSVDERVQHARPSVDVLFESAADAYGDGVIGVILTGANQDGAAGLARIKNRGGVAVIQDPVGAERRTMPDAAIAATIADAVLPLEAIGSFIYGLCVERPRSGGEAASPRSGPGEGVWGNREVPPAAKRPVRDSGPGEGVWGNREVPPAGTPG
jgi:two-component system, chemotaxis family, protein-glutamate methylesterase/glutaminase